MAESGLIAGEGATIRAPCHRETPPMTPHLLSGCMELHLQPMMIAVVVVCQSMVKGDPSGQPIGCKLHSSRSTWPLLGGRQDTGEDHNTPDHSIPGLQVRGRLPGLHTRRRLWQCTTSPIARTGDRLALRRLLRVAPAPRRLSRWARCIAAQPSLPQLVTSATQCHNRRSRYWRRRRPRESCS